MVKRKEKKRKETQSHQSLKHYLCGENAKESVFSINIIAFDKTCEQ